jgi:adenylosuccinate synthase
MMTPDTITQLYQQVYARGELFGVDRPQTHNPLHAAGARPRSIAVAGGAFGDEGKGRIVDELCSQMTRAGAAQTIIYRWNGGANAGHTVIVDGQRIALHQLPAGSLHSDATVVLGKGMVIHPGDLIEEIESIQPLLAGRPKFDLRIDAQAVLALDTHRAFEGALKAWESGGKGSTGRGISPAYADVLYRHPVRVGDLLTDEGMSRLGRHYDLYAALLGGLGASLADAQVPTLHGDKIAVGSRDAFISRLARQAAALREYIDGETPSLIAHAWADEAIPFVFEGAQGIGLDPRWGVYPDVTASDPTFDGIMHSTEGIVHARRIAVRAGALKATYTSSVGARRLPTQMPENEAHRIREDAHEYGATTRRPRDIAYIDLPCLRFFAEVSDMNALILTHLDLAYPDTPIRVCTHHADASGATAAYRPDQAYLNSVIPHYLDLPSWDGRAVQGARRLGDLPAAALQYIAFLSQALGCPPLMATTGPQREALIAWT